MNRLISKIIMTPVWLTLLHGCVTPEASQPVPPLQSIQREMNHPKISHIECYGSGRKGTAIFLHGIDDPKRANAGNREAINTAKEVADLLDLRLAIPRSKMPCQKGRKVCWNVSNAKEHIQDTWGAIQSVSNICFAPDMPPPIVIGFSNGGYFTNKLVHLCILDKDRQVLSFGAAGTIPTSASNLQQCSQLHLSLGRQEATYPAGKKYYDQMKQHKARIQLVTFQGGHIVHRDTLLQMLQRFMKAEVPSS